MSLLVPPRRPQQEMLDRGDLPPSEVEDSLADIRWVNLRLGGYRAAARCILPLLLAEKERSFRLLDLGSGSADVPAHLGRQAGREGVTLKTVAVDLRILHLATARRTNGSGPRLVTADVFSLPFPDSSFDWVLSTLFFHHFSPDQNVRILREMARLGRRGLFVVDLERHRIPLGVVKLMASVFFRSRTSMRDGITSLAQAYTRSEMEAIARRSGLGRFEARKIRPFRLFLFGRS
jgi:ubiquinone/menaquinone biosynthesis C-methylase UbiE